MEPIDVKITIKFTKNTKEAIAMENIGRKTDRGGCGLDGYFVPGTLRLALF